MGVSALEDEQSSSNASMLPEDRDDGEQAGDCTMDSLGISTTLFASSLANLCGIDIPPVIDDRRSCNRGLLEKGLHRLSDTSGRSIICGGILWEFIGVILESQSSSCCSVTGSKKDSDNSLMTSKSELVEEKHVILGCKCIKEGKLGLQQPCHRSSSLSSSLT
jgi:hypothetical protein